MFGFSSNKQKAGNFLVRCDALLLFTDFDISSTCFNVIKATVSALFSQNKKLKRKICYDFFNFESQAFLVTLLFAKNTLWIVASMKYVVLIDSNLLFLRNAKKRFNTFITHLTYKIKNVSITSNCKLLIFDND